MWVSAAAIMANAGIAQAIINRKQQALQGLALHIAQPSNVLAQHFRERLEVQTDSIRYEQRYTLDGVQVLSCDLLKHSADEIENLLRARLTPIYEQEMRDLAIPEIQDMKMKLALKRAELDITQYNIDKPDCWI